MRHATLLLLLALAQARLHFSGRRKLERFSGAHTEVHNNLVDSLRQQLMHDNYDYMSSASEDLLAGVPRTYVDTLPANARSFDAGQPRDDGDYFPAPPPRRPLFERPQRPKAQPSLKFEARASGLGAPYQRVQSNIPVSNKDLYYYVDDATLNAGALAFNALDVADALDNDDFDDVPPPPPSPPRKKKYTMLEIEGGGGMRRSGAGSRRRFVQEEGEDGIAIVSLDNAPFPEFRLPTDRRQYMHHEYMHDDAPNLLPNGGAPSQRHSLEHSQQEDELLYLS